MSGKKHTWQDTLDEVDRVSRRNEAREAREREIDPDDAVACIKELLEHLYDKETGIATGRSKSMVDTTRYIMSRHGFDGNKLTKLER